MSDVPTPPARETEFALAPLFARLWRRKIPFVATSAGIAALLYGWFATRPNVWQADAALVLAPAQVTTANPLQALASVSPSGTIRGILQSRTVGDAVKAKVGYTGDITDIQSVKEDVPTGRIIISGVHNDKTKALAVASESIAKLREIDQETGITLAAQRAKLLERTLVKREAELRFAETKLADFVATMQAPSSLEDQSASRYIDQKRQLESELKEVRAQIASTTASTLAAARGAGEVPTQVPGASQWRDKLVQAQNDLDIARVTYGPEAPEYRKAAEELKVIRRSLQNEVARYLRSVNEGIDANLAQLRAREAVIQVQLQDATKKAEAAPAEQTRLARLRLDAETKAAAVKQMRADLQLAQNDAEVQAIRYSLLDEPQILSKPINKGVVTLYVIPVFMAGLVGLVLFGRRGRDEV